MARKRKVIEGWAARIGIMYLTPAGHWAPLSMENTAIYSTEDAAIEAGRDALGGLLSLSQDYSVVAERVRQSLALVEFKQILVGGE